jgi:hypothetical protein
MSEKTNGTIKNGQCRDTGNMVHKTQNEDKQNSNMVHKTQNEDKQKHNTEN